MSEQSVSGRVAPYRSDQIVVALAHRDLVLGELSAMGIPASAGDSSADLGLGLVNFDAGQTSAALSEHGAAVAPIDAVLTELRLRFKAHYDKWAPVMGKNRVVERVSGEYVIGGGDEGIPAETTSQLAPRRAEPGSGVRVGIADTRLYPSPWLAEAYRAAPDALWSEFTGLGKAPLPAAAGHATFVAGTILREAPGATVEVRNVLGPDGYADAWEVAKQLAEFARAGNQVLNLSFGCFTDDNDPPLILSAAIDRLGPDVVVVAAAGNHQKRHAGKPLWPAALDDVIAVGAAHDDGRRADFSADGPWVDVLAPGVDLVSTFFDSSQEVVLPKEKEPDYTARFDGLATWSGTSFAAAAVSGAIAARTRPGRLDARTAAHELLASAQPGQPTPWLPIGRLS